MATWDLVTTEYVGARPAVNVKDYLAAGDGSTDDRGVIGQADEGAAAASTALQFPVGTYRVAADLTIDSTVWFLPGAVIKPDSGITVTLAGGIVNAPMSQIFDASAGGLVVVERAFELSPYWWGATGDGVTDDTVALQATFAGAAGGGTVLIPPGVFTYAEDLVLPRGTVLRGPGKDQQSGSTAARLLATHADARIRFDDHCHIQDLLIDGGGVANWGLQSVYVTAKPSFTNVFVMNFAEAGFVFDAAQNGVLTNCTVRNTPIGYYFLNGTAIFDVYACSFENYGTAGEGVGGTGARAILVSEDVVDSRLEGTLPYGRCRELHFYDGIYEYGPGDYRFEILYGHTTALGTITFQGVQVSGHSSSVGLLHVGANYPGEVLLSDVTWAFNGGAPTLVTAEGGTVRMRNVKMTGSGGYTVMSKTTVSGTAQAFYDEPTRSLIDSQFETSLYANPSYNWAAYSSGTPTWTSARRCMTMTLPSASAGVFAYFYGYQYYARQYDVLTIRFHIANATGPVRLAARLSAGGPTVLGVFGNGSHTVVHHLGGLEVGLVFLSDENTSITADLTNFRCEHGGDNAGASNRAAAAYLNFSVLAASSYEDLTVTATGAITGDAVALGVPTAAVTAGVAFTAWVSAADTVTVRAHNYTTGTPNPAGGYFRVVVIR